MVTIVVARSRNRVIGKNGQIPWHLPADMAHFKKLTTDQTVIMGRKTFESIGKALPNRRNIVITTDASFEAENVRVADSFDRALLLASQFNTYYYVIGGERVYQAALASGQVDAIELTLVNTQIPDGDTFFPFTPPNEWIVVHADKAQADPKTGLEFAFLRYEPVKNYPGNPQLLYLPAARFNDQAGYMEEILNDGVCPFCPEWLGWYHENPIEVETEHWIVTKNDNPYIGTLHDILLIPKKHVEHFLHLNQAERADFALALSNAMISYNLPYGALGMRFGDMSKTGGSVAHLHAHVKVGDVDNPDHKPVRFKMSSIPQENKAPTLTE